MTTLVESRIKKDTFFAHHPQSPLTKEQKATFKELNYFTEATDLRLKVQIERFDDQGEIQIPTSTGGFQVYQRFGKFKFQVGPQEAELTIYSSPNGYFLPFVDSMAGEETYPAGRYLEPEAIGNDQFLIDFNLAYNPYCAYNDRWACPLTPAENRLSVPIKAGEKNFHP